jgi:endonuclease/exonuclease/phosphatase family metal-dependent hydrolase
LPLVRDFFSIGFNAYKPEGDTPHIKVMSYNVRNFDLYNWSHNEQSRKGMFAIINDESPDIACFQEYYTQDSGFYNNTSLLKTKAGFKYAHVEINYILYKKQKWGIATFTNYPIINKGVVKFDTRTKNIAIYTDIVTPLDTFRVINVHLQSYRLAQKDYDYIDGLQQGKSIDGESNKRIANKLKNAFSVRAEQVQTLNKYINNSPYKVILCGDFNDTPISYTYDQLTYRLDDAFLQSGWGIGHTYINPLPLFRIDFILLDPSYVAYNYHSIRKEYSDHYPIITNLRKR